MNTDFLAHIQAAELNQQAQMRLREAAELQRQADLAATRERQLQQEAQRELEQANQRVLAMAGDKVRSTKRSSDCCSHNSRVDYLLETNCMKLT